MSPIRVAISLDPDYDSDPDNLAAGHDLNFSLGPDYESDPDDSATGISSLFDTNAPTLLVTGHVTRQTDPQAATGPPAPCRTTNLHPLSNQPNHDAAADSESANSSPASCW